ncbi:MAG: Rrf2 family transcriptional regulator [Candidatus Magasanikbacteria bacterium]|nr:Rrf2 family transcriptional regulator [Candidatus Magasanikbacteria bacterium]
MFQISKQVDYAIQLINRLIILKAGKALSLRVFSEESSISFLFLQKIARQLKQHKLIASSKGKKGGYYLMRSPTTISLKDVIEAIEGPYGVVVCMKNPKLCNKVDRCKTRHVWQGLNDKVLRELEQTKIVPAT